MNIWCNEALKDMSNVCVFYSPGNKNVSSNAMLG